LPCQTDIHWITNFVETEIAVVDGFWQCQTLAETGGYLEECRQNEHFEGPGHPVSEPEIGATNLPRFVSICSAWPDRRSPRICQGACLFNKLMSIRTIRFHRTVIFVTPKRHPRLLPMPSSTASSQK
jgi:hypothetical protein